MTQDAREYEDWLDEQERRKFYGFERSDEAEALAQERGEAEYDAVPEEEKEKVWQQVEADIDAEEDAITYYQIYGASDTADYDKWLRGQQQMAAYLEQEETDDLAI